MQYHPAKERLTTFSTRGISGSGLGYHAEDASEALWTDPLREQIMYLADAVRLGDGGGWAVELRHKVGVDGLRTVCDG